MGRKLLLFMGARTEELVCGQPGAVVVLRREERVLTIRIRRESREVVVTSFPEEAAKKEGVLEGFGVVGHVRRRYIHVRERLPQGDGSGPSSFVWPREVSDRLSNVLGRRVEVRGCLLYVFERVVDLL